jgi:hypothetical protein
VTEGEEPKRPPRRTTARTKPRATTADRTTAVTEPAPVQPEERAEPAPPPPRMPLGRIALGLILLAIGLGWLLQSLDLIEVPWEALLPVSLIAIGAVLVVGARTGHHSGLIALGIVLTLVTALTAAVDVPLIGGAGQRVISPRSVAELEPRYDLALGQLVIDLSHLKLQPNERVDIEARVGLGELVVAVPAGVPIEGLARAGLGEVQVLGDQASGFTPERVLEGCGGRHSMGRRRSSACLVLDLSVGLGSVKVND